MNLGQENETTEFKESLSQLDRGIRSLSAMLNRSGSGRVFFGVDDNGNVKGLQIGKKTLLDIRNKINLLISPQILASIYEKQDDSGNSYIEVTANGFDIPYACDGRYYVRNAAADEQASVSILRKMLASGTSDIIAEIASDDQHLSFKQFFMFLAQSGIHASESAVFYKNYGFMTADGRYNYMAYLLSDQNASSIKVVKFSGTDKTVMSERTEFGGQCLLKSMMNVLDYFKLLNTTQVNLNAGLRSETTLFDYESFREAWVNACLHNEWSGKIPPSVFIFDDRIEIVSYGGLPYGLSEEGFYKGTSKPVNRALLTVFIATGFAEQSGHGVPIIVSHYGKEAFTFEDGMLKVTLKFLFEPEPVVLRKLLEKRRSKLSDSNRKILAELKGSPQITQKDLADRLDISLGGIKKCIRQLQELHLVERKGSKRRGEWIVIDGSDRKFE